MSFFYERLLPKTQIVFDENEYIIDIKKDDYLVLKHARMATLRIVYKCEVVKAKAKNEFRLVSNCLPYLQSTLSESQREKIQLDEKIAQAIAKSPNPFSKVILSGTEIYYAQILARQVLDDEGHTATSTPSKSKLHRLMSDYSKTGGDLSKLYIGKISKRGKRIPAEIERLLRTIIESHYMTENKPSISSTYRALKRACPASLRGQLPDESTLRRRIGELTIADVIKARDGFDAYRNYIRSSKSKIVVERLLQRVELDAMHVILGLVDEKGVFIGYFTLYLAIDTASRMIVGYHIEPKTKLRGETPSGVLGSINSILSDNTIFPMTKYTNPISGIPEAFVMDHGTAYQCKEVFRQLEHLKISFENTGTKRGSGKGIIERFIKTLRLRFFREIKGYRDSKLSQKYISSKQPKHDNCIKLSELRMALEHFIYEEYAFSAHSGIEDTTPKKLWDTIYEGVPTLPADEVDITTVRAEHVQLTPHMQNGIRFKHQKFKSAALRELCIDLARVKTNGKIGKVDVFYNAFDASIVTIIDPITKETIDAFNDDPRIKPHVSFVEVNAKRKKNREEQAEIDDSTENLSTRPALSDNKLPKSTRRRAGIDIPEDSEDNPVSCEDMFSKKNGVKERKSHKQLEAEKLNFDENKTGLTWEE